MLYQLFEWQHAAWAPMRVATAATRAALESMPAGARNAYTDAWLAGCELFERMTRRYEQPTFRLDSTITDDRLVAVRTEPVWQRPFGSLIHFVRDSDREDPRLLVIPPLSGHFPTLLRGTVEALLPEHDVYVAQWANARDVPLSAGRFDLEDYVEYVIEMVRELGPDVHVLGVCQPVVPVLAAVSVMAEDGDPAQPRSMTLMAGPVDARQSPTAVNDFANSKPLGWFERHMLASVPGVYEGARRRVYPGFLQLGAFMAMNLDRHIGSHMNLFEDVAGGNRAAADRHREFYDEYFAVMDMTAEYYLQTVDAVFQRYALAKGEFTYRGRLVDPSAIQRTALLTVEGERDDISGLGQTRAAHDLCTSIPESMKAHHEQPDVGHYGVFSGHRWRNETMPIVREFVLKHNRHD